MSGRVNVRAGPVQALGGGAGHSAWSHQEALSGVTRGLLHSSPPTVGSSHQPESLSGCRRTGTGGLQLTGGSALGRLTFFSWYSFLQVDDLNTLTTRFTRPEAPLSKGQIVPTPRDHRLGCVASSPRSGSRASLLSRQVCELSPRPTHPSSLSPPFCCSLLTRVCSGCWAQE